MPEGLAIHQEASEVSTVDADYVHPGVRELLILARSFRVPDCLSSSSMGCVTGSPIEHALANR